jgi:hypothetical protein
VSLAAPRKLVADAHAVLLRLGLQHGLRNKLGSGRSAAYQAAARFFSVFGTSLSISGLVGALVPFGLNRAQASRLE